MEEMVSIEVDAMSGWLSQETDDQMHSRVFRMTEITAVAFGWPIGGDEFFNGYNRFLGIAKEARLHHEQLVLMSLLTLQDLFESGGVGFLQAFESEEEVHDALRFAVRRLYFIFEQSLFASNNIKKREQLETLPSEMTTVSFNFIKDTSQDDADGEDSEVLYNVFEGLDGPDDEIERLLDLWYGDDKGELP